MSSLVNLSDYLVQRTSGLYEDLWWMRAGAVAGAALTTPVAGYEHSLWVCDGQPATGATPTTAVVPTNATAGSLQQSDPGGGRQKWLSALEAFTSQNVSSTAATGTLTLYDRLLQIGGLSASNTGAQTVQSSGSPALTRYTDGLGNEIWVEINTQIGTVATTITASYTNENGSTHTTQAVTFGGTNFREKTRLIRLPLAAGDKGVKAIASVTVLADTTTAGDFGVVVAHPLATLEVMTAATSSFRPFTAGQPGLIEILTGACLALVWLSRGTAVPNITGVLHMVEK
jgi:hypothetical protein